ncbi:MAG TPA: hypothetical protein VK172_14665 [Lentimicrobium sp.]|nr:hypothetical protein [Bacteroidales bacterium]HLO92404.1 hypothetical protein [Lentimicrobium sp.]
MRHLVISFMFVCAIYNASCQTPHRINRDVEIDGYLYPKPQPSLPIIGHPGQLENFNDTLWIYYSNAWQSLMPVAEGYTINVSDTLQDIYLINSMKFVGSGYIKRYSSSAIELSPNGADSSYIRFSQNYTIGTTLSGLQTLWFGKNGDPYFPYQDYMRAFTDDTIPNHSDASSTALSIAGIRKLINRAIQTAAPNFTLAINQIPYATSANHIGGTENLKWQPGTSTLEISSGVAQMNISSSILGITTSNLERTRLAPGYNGTASNYLFTSTIARTTGSHTEFIDAGKSLFRIWRDSLVAEVPIAVKGGIKGDITATKLAGHAGQIVSVDADGKLVILKQRKQFAIICTTTQDATTLTSIYAPIGADYNGWNLIRVEVIYGAAQGTAIPVVNISRYRGTTEAIMTSTGGNFTTNATINTANDDVATGDRVCAKWVWGSGIVATGFSVLLTWEKP